MLALLTNTFTQGRLVLIGIALITAAAVSAYAYHQITVLKLEHTVSEQLVQIERLNTDISRLNADIRTLQANQEILESAAQENQELIQRLQSHAAEQASKAQSLTATIQNLQSEKQRYLAIFREHDLTKLSRAKPGLIENRINQGTQDVFRNIEQETQK